MNINNNLALNMLKQNEGVELQAYKDSLGIYTIGIGRNLQDVGLSPQEYSSIFSKRGSGINVCWGQLTQSDKCFLLDVGISSLNVVELFENDISKVVNLLSRQEWFSNLDAVRTLVLVDMCFNMGLTRLLGFEKMLSCLASGNYEGASTEMLNSQWASQVGNRATRDAKAMLTGNEEDLFI